MKNTDGLASDPKDGHLWGKIVGDIDTGETHSVVTVVVDGVIHVIKFIANIELLPDTRPGRLIRLKRDGNGELKVAVVI